MKKLLYLLPLVAALLTTSCSSDDDNAPTGGTQTGSETASKEISGMYILNEGSWGYNNATIDFLNLSVAPVVYNTNVFHSQNIAAVLGLGDVANDMKIYGNKLWIVVNGSNKVVVADATTCVQLGQVDVPNCRSLTFYGGHAYVSSYAGTSMANGNASPGCVYKIDTLTFNIAARTDVGYQPEDLVTGGRLLYVANSGGYCAPNYDRTISVIDLVTDSVVSTIDVDINLHLLRTDSKGGLWVTSRGDYIENGPKLYYIDVNTPSKPTPKKILDKAPADFCIVGDSLYYYSSEWSYTTNSYANSYGIINTSTQQKVATTLFKTPADEDNIITPYGIIVNPYTKDFYIMDGIDYTSSGKVHHFKADGSYDCSYQSGVLPKRAAFLMKK